MAIATGGGLTAEDSGETISAARNVAAQQEEHRNEPARIVERLMQSLKPLSRSTETIGSFKKGGVVKKTGPYKLHAGETVIPAEGQDMQAPDDNTQAAPQNAFAALDAKAKQSGPQQDDSQQDDSQAAPAAADGADESAESVEDAAAVDEQTVNLRKLYSGVQEALIELNDSCGVRRAFTVDYILGQEAADHFHAIAAAAQPVGGLSQNVILSAHHSSGKGWGSDQGHSVGFSTEKLRQTLVPKISNAKDNDPAKNVIIAAQKLASAFAFLLGDTTPVVQTLRAQLKIVGSHGLIGLDLFSVDSAYVHAFTRPIQIAAQNHQVHKHGQHHPTPTAPLQS